MPVFGKIIKRFSLKSEGVQKGFGLVKDMHLFTDPKTGSTLAARSEKELTSKVIESRKKFGVGTAVGAGVLATAQPDEAEAMPIGRFIPSAKAAAKELGGTVSSTASRVIGTPIRDKVIANVVKAKKGDWRYLIFEDGSTLPITKDYLQDLVRSVGTQKQMKKLGELRPKGLAPGKTQRQITRQRKQAGISLTRRAGAASEGTLGTTQQSREFKEASMERLRELDPALVPETVFVRYEGRTLFMPKGYADILEKQGKVEILKGKPKVGKRPFKNPFER